MDEEDPLLPTSDHRRNLFLGNAHTHREIAEDDDDDNDDDDAVEEQSSRRDARTGHLHRARTAPAMSSLVDVLDMHGNVSPFPGIRAQLARQSLLFLAAYLTFGVLAYAIGSQDGHFVAHETHVLVDALYFSVVTMCTIGYGDITPLSPLAKAFSIAFVLVGFGFVDIMLTAMLSHYLHEQEELLLKRRSFAVDVEKGRMRIRMKVALAMGVVVVCIGVGMVAMHCMENLAWFDALYLSVMSVTTVGYGDEAFKSIGGRLFASVWLLLSTLAVGRSFVYLAEARIEKRHRRVAKWVLTKEFTVSEFLAADMDADGFLSEAEYLVYKLKEMGKISVKDVLPICNQFEKLDEERRGKITLSVLLESRRHISSDG